MAKCETEAFLNRGFSFEGKIVRQEEVTNKTNYISYGICDIGIHVGIQQ
jgi:hypothetical protein